MESQEYSWIPRLDEALSIIKSSLIKQPACFIKALSVHCTEISCTFHEPMKTGFQIIINKYKCFQIKITELIKHATLDRFLSRRDGCNFNPQDTFILLIFIP